jgi:hypothetical protein
MNVSGADRARWVRRGETVHVSSFGLFTGMFYVGKSFPPETAVHNRYIINPTLPIGRSSREYNPSHDPYGASYEQLHPAGRRAYLEWISGSCRDTDIPLQFVMLYCGGLYYRVFVEKGGDRETIFAEARRLIVLHRSNAVFVQLLGDLLVFGTALDAERGRVPTLMDEWRWSQHPAASVVVRIASLVAARSPVGAEDAFQFAVERAKSEKRFVDPASVRLLWKRMYAGRYPDGYPVEAQLPRLKITVQMPDNVRYVTVPLPDWAKALPDPRLALRFCADIDSMLVECVREMESYSRLVRRSPGAAGTLEAVAVLPKELVATSLAGRFSTLKTALDNQLSKQGVTVSSVDQLFRFMELPFRSDEEIAPSVRRLISVALDKMDISFEPDPRYGASTFTMEGHVVFFRGENGSPVVWEGAYAIHRACADFIISNVCDPGLFDAAERVLFEVRQGDPELSDVERVRLGAHARSLVRNHGIGKPPPFKQARLDIDEKATLARTVIDVVRRLGITESGAISKTEKFLKKIGADRRSLHVALHRAAARDEDGLVSVVAGEPAGGVPIPKRPDEVVRDQPTLPRLDLERLRGIEEETVLVADLLHGIFAEEAIGPDDSAVSRPSDGAFAGLDASHSAVLASVMAAGSLARVDFDALAKSNRLLPDGAIETINDFSFDLCGEAALVDNGYVIFEEHLRGVLEQARENP